MPIIWLIGCYCFLLVFMDNRIDYLLDSDMSSELVLARLLAEEGGIVSSKWYYSTEIRILNTQLVFTPLFNIFKDWHQIRVFGSAILYLILIVCIWYFCRYAKLKKYFPIIAAILILPVSRNYFNNVLTGLYYIPHIAASFFLFGLVFQFMECKRKKIRMLLLLGGGCVSVLVGMGGLRQLMVFFLPFTFAVLFMLYMYREELNKLWNDGKKINKWVNLAVVTCWIDICAAAGYLINSKLLSQWFSFMKYGHVKYSSFSMDSVIKVLNGLLNSLGFHADEMVFSFGTVYNLLCALFVVFLGYCIWNSIRHGKKQEIESQLVVVYFIIAVAVFFMLYAMTNMDYTDRYNLPIIAFAFPIMVKGLAHVKFKPIYKNMMFVFFCFTISICSLVSYKRYEQIDKTKELREITSVIKKMGLEEGYATFWNANVITELSSGRISVRDWGTAPDDLVDVNQTHQWLHLVEYDNTVPEGRLFCLFTKDQNEKFTLAKILGTNNIFYQTQSYVVYGFTSYEMLLKQLTSYTADFKDGKWLDRGQDVDGVRHVYQGGVSYGPYYLLYPGRYKIEFSGANLDKGKLDCVFTESNRRSELPMLNIVANSQMVSYEIDIEKTIRDVEFRLSNKSDQEISITGLSVTRIEGGKE